MHPKMLEIVGGDEAIYPHRLEKDFDENGWTPLHKAVANGHTEAARILLGAGADAQARHRDGLTPADIAGAKGRPEMLRLFGLS